MEEEKVIEIIKKAATEYGSETAKVEFKDGRGGLQKRTSEAISAFSHKPGGGIIVFGVIDDKIHKRISFVNLNNIADLQESFSSMISEMSFTIRPDYFILNINDSQILAVYIPECPDQFKPCYYKPTGLPNGAFIRDGNTNKKMTEDEMRHLISLSKRLKIDRLIAEGTSLSDLDSEKIKVFLTESAERTKRMSADNSPTFEVLKNLGIADDFKNIKAPTVGGFLIFSKDNNPQAFPYFSRYVIRCVRYKGLSVSSEIIDKIDIKGTLDYQIDEMEKFILRNIKKSAKIIKTKRFERYEYPEEALRELIANAVIHRDYQITETYTQVNIFEDRIEILNPGCLPPGITVENIKDSQFSRNEVMAATLKDMGYMEEYGRGIDIVFDKMLEWGLPKPIFKNTANSFKVILPGEKLHSLNERQMQIWDYLIDNKTINAKQCEKLLRGVPRPTLNRDISSMQKMYLIEPVGSSVSRYYKLKF